VSFADEVLRVHQRFLVEVIEQLNLCPWAEGTRSSGALRRVVVLEQNPVDELLALGDEVLVCILIWPRFFAGPHKFEALLAQLRRDEEARRGARSPFVTALFHPRLDYSTATPDQLVPLFRRSPDPSVQFIRHAALESVRSAAPSGKFLFDGSAAAWAEIERRLKRTPVSEQIALDNAASVEKFGVERLLAHYRELYADRDAAYARFGEK
jgi:hypothetical protein